MRTRVVRDLVTVLGVVGILAGLVLLNGYWQRSGLTAVKDAERKKEEETQATKGIGITKWDSFKKTKGTGRSGPTFAKELLDLKDQTVNMVGFMVPLYEFRAMKEFILLPLPIECYFCMQPPMREVMLVQMQKDSPIDLVKEPVALSGKLTLNEGPGTKFFYVLKEATGAGGIKSAQVTQGKTKTSTSMQHVIEAAGQKDKEQGKKEEMLEGHEPPKAAPKTPATETPVATPAPAPTPEQAPAEAPAPTPAPTEAPAPPTAQAPAETPAPTPPAQ